MKSNKILLQKIVRSKKLGLIMRPCQKTWFIIRKRERDFLRNYKRKQNWLVSLRNTQSNYRFYNFMSNSSQTLHLKMVSFGPKKSGKTCLIKRYCERVFENEYHPTIGVDYGLKFFQIKKETLALNIFDLSGDEKFSDVIKETLKKFDVLLLVISLEKEGHFEWL